MTLIFKNSNIGCYQIVEVNGRKFVMDTSTMNPKSYYWGALPEKITVDMFELSPENTQFEIKSRTTLQTTTIALMVQPFVNMGYRIMKHFFQSYDISQQLMLKSFLYLVSLLISYGIFRYTLKKAQHKAAMQLPDNPRRFEVTFQPKKKRNPMLFLFLGLNLLCLLFYLSWNNGTEGVFLALNGILALPVYIGWLSIPPIGTSYRQGQLLLKRIREIE